MKKTAKIFVLLIVLAACLLVLLTLFGIVPKESLEENMMMIGVSFGTLMVAGLAIGLLSGGESQD